MEILVKEMGLAESNTVATPGAKTREGKSDQADQQLDKPEGRRYRAYAARANYLAQDRPDIAFAVKEACRDMNAPTTSSWEKIKRVVRYIRGKPRVVYD